MSEDKRIVTLEDGSTADFGKRNNVLQVIDLEAGVITFKVFTGEVITLDFTEVEALKWSEQSDLAKTIISYGVSAKVKSTIAGTKLQEVKDDETIVNVLADTIKDTVANIVAGEFSSRNAVAAGEEELSDEVKYFAVAAGAFEKFPFANPEFAVAIKREENLLLWNDETPVEVQAKIVAAWDALDRKQKGIARKSPYFAMVQGHGLQYLLTQAAV